MTRRNKRWDNPRYPIIKTAIVLNKGYEQTCIIEERSPSGARIRLNTDFPLAKHFARETLPGSFVSVRKVWQRDDRVGVRLDVKLRQPGFLRQFWDWL